MAHGIGVQVVGSRAGVHGHDNAIAVVALPAVVEPVVAAAGPLVHQLVVAAVTASGQHHRLGGDVVGGAVVALGIHAGDVAVVVVGQIGDGGGQERLAAVGDVIVVHGVKVLLGLVVGHAGALAVGAEGVHAVGGEQVGLLGGGGQSHGAALGHTLHAALQHEAHHGLGEGHAVLHDLLQAQTGGGNHGLVGLGVDRGVLVGVGGDIVGVVPLGVLLAVAVVGDGGLIGV